MNESVLDVAWFQSATVLIFTQYENDASTPLGLPWPLASIKLLPVVFALIYSVLFPASLKFEPFEHFSFLNPN